MRLHDRDAAQRLLPMIEPHSGSLLVGYGQSTLECAADRCVGQLLFTLGDPVGAARSGGAFHRARVTLSPSRRSRSGRLVIQECLGDEQLQP